MTVLLCCWTEQGNVFVNQYLIIKDLGRGAHGTVKLVLHTEEQKVYAMKVLCCTQQSAGWPGALRLSDLQLKLLCLGDL
jgi:serine/threonine protein kinase